MSTKESIIYSGFYDFPLAFVVSHDGKQFLFYRGFDEALDEYEDKYRVYLLPNLFQEDIERSWRDIGNRAIAFLGEVPVREVHFDPSHRKEIETDVLRPFLTLDN